MKQRKTTVFSVLKKEVEKQIVADLIKWHKGNISQTAKHLQIDRSNLNRIMRKHNIKRLELL